MSHNKKLICTIAVAAMLGACSSNPAAPDSKQANNKQRTKSEQILAHCTVVREYGMAYAARRATGMSKETSWDKAAAEVAAQHTIGDHEKWKTITGIYAAFVEMLQPHRPDTTSYFVLSHCLVTHAQRKSMPLTTEKGRTAINRVLASCEQTSQTDDDLGACVLNGLRPLAM